MSEQVDTPIPPDNAEISKVMPSPGVPRGMAVMVGAHKVVIWMGPATDMPATAWAAGAVLSVNRLDFEFLKQRVARAEKGIPVQ